MRKDALVCASFLVLGALASAQLAAATTFNFGVKAGISYTNVVWSDDVGTEKGFWKPNFGVFAVINLKPSLAIQPEVNYLTTGGKRVETTYTDVETFDYLHIPVLVKYSFAPRGKITPAVFAGPALGILLSARRKLLGVEDSDLGRNDWFKSTDFGFDFGLGAEMAIGQMRCLVDLRYYLGLINVYEPVPTPQTMAIIDRTMKNRGFVLTVGLVF